MLQCGFLKEYPSVTTFTCYMDGISVLCHTRDIQKRLTKIYSMDNPSNLASHGRLLGATE